jgi:hypothetical protein
MLMFIMPELWYSFAHVSANKESILDDRTPPPGIITIRLSACFIKELRIVEPSVAVFCNPDVSMRVQPVAITSSKA